MKVISLQGNHAKSIDEALDEAKEMDWADIIVIGYGAKGEFQCISSHMDNNAANMIADILKSHILKAFYTGEAE